MTLWLGVLLGVVFGGVCGFVLWVMVLPRLARRYGPNDVPIGRPRQKFAGFDERLRERTETRRRAAEGIRARAARVDSGSSVSDVLRRVK